MKAILLLISFLCISFADDDVKREENVLVLTTANFDSVINGNKYVLAEFCEYDVMCQPCCN